MLPPLPDRAIHLEAKVSDWRAAVRAAGYALQRSGATTAAYTERMVGAIDTFGAYIVVAPGLALAHARPGRDVKRDGVSVVTLADPVDFGHPHNDPVSVVIGLAVTTADEHVGLVAELANIFNDPTMIPALAAAKDPASVREILRGDVVKVVAICGVGIGTAAILKLNAERALDRLGIDAVVSATDVAGVGIAAADAQVILTSPELVDHIGATNADVVVIQNYFDLDEIATKLETALG